MKKLLLTLALILTLSVASFAQFETNVELRNRVEYRDGYKKPLLTTQDPNFLMFQRSRLNLNYKHNKFAVYVTVQDARVWGDDLTISTTGTGDNPSLALYKAYAEYQLDTLTSFTLGRQELKYDNQRMLGTRNWGNTGLTYDAFVFKTSIKGFNLHAGITWNNLTEASSDNLYPAERTKTQDFIWLNKKYKELNVSLIQMFNGVTKSDTSNVLYMKQTSGIYASYNIKGFSVEGDYYYQWGENNKSQKVSAMLGSLDMKYKIKFAEIGLGATYISGDNDVTDGIDKTFDLLYGKRHGWYGGMDYFSTISKDTLIFQNLDGLNKNGGLIDGYGYLTFAINKNIKLKDYFHYFQLAQENTTTPTAGKKLGIENDITAEFKIGKNFTIETGYMLLSPSESMNKIKSTADAKLQHFGYVQLAFNTDIFKIGSK
jgi:hypothetical protein